MFLKVYKCIGQTSPRTSTIQFLEIARRPGRLFAAWLDADSIALLDDVWRACRHVESQNRSHNDQANVSGSAVLAPVTTLGEFVVFDESQVFPEYIVPGLESVVVLWSTHVAAERFKCFTFCPRLWCSFAYWAPYYILTTSITLRGNPSLNLGWGLLNTAGCTLATYQKQSGWKTVESIGPQIMWLQIEEKAIFARIAVNQKRDHRQNQRINSFTSLLKLNASKIKQDGSHIEGNSRCFGSGWTF